MKLIPRSSRAYWLVIVSILTLAAAGLSRAPGARVPVGPHAVFTVTRRDLGAVNAGATASMTFPLRNDGDRPLHIFSVEGDCGCVKPEFPRIVPAGKSAAITARFEAEALWDGLVEKGLRVKSDDPTQPEIKLAVAARVIPFIAMKPGSPLIIPHQRGQTYRHEILLTPRADSKLGISNPRSDSPLVKTTLTPPAAGDRTRTYRLHLTIGPCNQPGDFSATVKMDTTEQRLAERWFVVVGLAQSGPVASPREVSLSGLRATGAGQELARLQVFARTGELHLKSVETGSRLLRAKIEPRIPARVYDVVVTAAERLKPGPLETTLRIRTDDPKSPVLAVPFNATVQ